MANPRSRWVVGITVVALVLGLAGYLLLGREKPSSEGGLSAPSYSLESIDGKRVQSKDFEDHVTVVHFWASWCAPCIPELPEVLGAAQKLQKDIVNRPIRWVLISVDETWEKARKVLDPSKLPPNAIALLDPDSKIAEAFGTFQYPETYVVDRKGKFAAKWIGPQEWSGEWGKGALDAIETLSRTQKPPQPVTPANHPTYQ